MSAHMAQSFTRPQSPVRPMDPQLVARMTGRLGDRRTIEQTGSALAAALCEPVCEAIFNATGIRLTAAAGRVETGQFNALLGAAARSGVQCPASLATFCDTIGLCLDRRLAVLLIESLLGGAIGRLSPAAATREISGIELDISVVFFEQAAQALKTTVKAPVSALCSVGRPIAGENPEPEASLDDIHAVLFTVDLALEKFVAPLTFVVPQAVLLKLDLGVLKPEKKAPATKPEWAQRLSERVTRSDVELQATMRLAPMTLGDVSRLQVGDMLHFEEKELRVLLKANGKPLYWCELGKSGTRFMVRVDTPHSADDDQPPKDNRRGRLSD